MGLVGEAQVQAVVKEMAAKVKKVHIDKFTALCKNLQRRQEVEDEGGDDGAYDNDPLVRPSATYYTHCTYISIIPQLFIFCKWQIDKFKRRAHVNPDDTLGSFSGGANATLSLLSLPLSLCLSLSLQPAPRAPFELTKTPANQSGLVLHNNAWKTPNQIVAESNMLQAERPLPEKFPVSSGIEHQQQENTFGPSNTAADINVFSGTKVSS